ncbi:MAG: AAA family ATPase [Nannocystaceae bacterium]
MHQWRPIIFERIGSRAEQGPFTLWVTSKKEGLASFPAATAAAAFLLGAGLGSWVMRQLSGLEATRRLLAYLFRREVAKRAAATVADERFVPIDARTRAVFERGVSPDAVLADVAAAQIDRVAELASSPRPTLSIVVGERGLGKSMFLERVAAKLGRDKVRVMSCPEAGFEALLGELAALAGDPKLRGHALAEALRAKGPLVIALDDLQRLVVPAVNGLQDLDAFTTFAREVGGTVSWVATIGSASWHYVTRARGDRVFFEQVVMIPRWTEDELGELIQGKCAEAEVQPSFDGLVVPRQSQAPLPDQGNRTEAGYYRLLWDFSKGNPAVALRAFGESLFVGPDGNVVVRLFKTPPAEEIEDLPLSILFVLRSVVQLEWADVREVEAATQLPTSDIEDAFRFCQTRGYLEPVGGGVRMAWTWYRTITTVLQRQHLLSSI